MKVILKIIHLKEEEYMNNGNRYEGEFKNNKREGKGIMYYSNGDREFGNYKNDKPKGKHAILIEDFIIKEKFYF